MAQDFLLKETDRAKLYRGELNQGAADALIATGTTTPYRTTKCVQYANKMVLLFAEGTEITHAPTQPGWRRCTKCEGLFFGGQNTTAGTCPSGGQHTADTSRNFAPYLFWYDQFSLDPTSADLEHGWRYCHKCQGLFDNNGIHNHCPAGGLHDGSESGFYVLDPIDGKEESLAKGTNNTQSEWRLCNRCQGLFYGNHLAASNCPAGGLHNMVGSGNYLLLTDKSTPRQVAYSPSSGGFSAGNSAYVRLGASIGTNPGSVSFVAHEIGHYLNLSHTFVPFSVPWEKQKEPAANKVTYLQNAIRQYVEQQLAEKKVTKATILNALDGDLGDDVKDTPADDSGELLDNMNAAAKAGGNACGTIGTCVIPLSDGTKLTYTPDRGLVMSYFKHCENFVQRFSHDQAVRMRKHITGPRRALVAVQLGDTAAPQERMCAVWSPNTAGQGYVTGLTIEAFKEKIEQMNKAGFRLSSQQAYLRNGVTLYDGIFNPGNVPETMVWGWTVAGFQKKDAELIQTGWRVIHIESYLLADGQVRINAIWNQTNQITGWALAQTGGDLNSKLLVWKKQGLQPTQVNALRRPDNQVCYDVIVKPGNPGASCFVDRTEKAFLEMYDTMWKNNQKLLSLDCTTAPDGTWRFHGIIVPDAPPQYIRWNAPREQVRETYDEMWAQGWKLRSMTMQRV